MSAATHTPGWTFPRMVAQGLRESDDLVVYRATQAAVRDAELSGRGRLTQPTTYYDFSLLSARPVEGLERCPECQRMELDVDWCYACRRLVFAPWLAASAKATGSAS